MKALRLAYRAFEFHPFRLSKVGPTLFPCHISAGPEFYLPCSAITFLNFRDEVNKRGSHDAAAVNLAGFQFIFQKRVCAAPAALGTIGFVSVIIKWSD